jgi:hypothetical protein
MKYQRVSLIAGSVAVVAMAFAAGVWAQTAVSRAAPANVWRWPDALDSINAAPKNHKVLFENDHIRLLEVTVQPGETENMHGHKYPSVFMMDAPQPRIINKNLEEEDKDKPNSSSSGDRQPPPPRPDGATVRYPTCRAMPFPQSPHQVTNTDSFPQHFYRMEFKKIDGDTVKSMAKYPAE